MKKKKEDNPIKEKDTIFYIDEGASFKNIEEIISFFSGNWIESEKTHDEVELFFDYDPYSGTAISFRGYPKKEYQLAHDEQYQEYLRLKEIYEQPTNMNI